MKYSVSAFICNLETVKYVHFFPYELFFGDIFSQSKAIKIFSYQR